jgi:hypothetical protein
MSNKVVADKPIAAPKPPVKSVDKYTVSVKPICEFEEHNDPELIDVPGWVFSWQNAFTKDNNGWGHHLPVERDTDLGEVVGAQFGVSGEQYIGLNVGSNRFHLGGELVLAYTSEEIHDKAITDKQKRADKQLAIVEQETGVTRFSVQNPGLKKR